MRILIATDGSKFSEAAIRKACDFARSAEHACFRVMTVYEPQTPMASEPWAMSAEYFDHLDELAEKQARKICEQGVDLIKHCFPNQRVCVTPVVEMGRPEQMIVEAAEDWNADLIIVGSHGHGFWGRLALGSVSDAIVHHAGCSVLVVKTEGEEG